MNCVKRRPHVQRSAGSVRSAKLDSIHCQKAQSRRRAIWRRGLCTCQLWFGCVKTRAQSRRVTHSVRQSRTVPWQSVLLVHHELNMSDWSFIQVSAQWWGLIIHFRHVSVATFDSSWNRLQSRSRRNTSGWLPSSCVLDEGTWEHFRLSFTIFRTINGMPMDDSYCISGDASLHGGPKPRVLVWVGVFFNLSTLVPSKNFQSSSTDVWKVAASVAVSVKYCRKPPGTTSSEYLPSCSIHNECFPGLLKVQLTWANKPLGKVHKVQAYKTKKLSKSHGLF